MFRLLVVALLFANATFAAPLILQGAGSTFQAAVEDSWRNSYNLLRPNTEAVYAPVGSGTGQTRIRGLVVDWAGTDLQPTASDAQTYTTIHQFPIVAGQVALLVNYKDSRGNTLGYATSTATYIPLNLTREAVFGIFTGTVHMWNDPLILASNPYMATFASDFNRTINVAIRKDSSGTTSILMTALYGFNATGYNTTAFTYPPTTNQAFTFPGSVDPPNFTRWTGSTGVSGYVQTTSFSIGYAAINYALLDLVPVAYVQNRQLNFVSPYDTANSSIALNNITLTSPYPTYFYGTVTDYDDGTPQTALIYPLLAYTYIQIHLPDDNETYPEANFTRLREVLKIFRWAFTTDATRTAATQLGFIPLPENSVNFLLTQFNALEANGQRFLAIKHRHQHSSKLIQVLLAFSMFFWALSLVAVGYAWWSSSRAKNPLFYALCLATGVSLAYCSVIFFYLIPRHTAICELRKWLLTTGLSLLLGVMFARGWQLHALKSGPRVISTLKLLIIVSIISAVQFIILIVWTAVDPWKSLDTPTNNIDLINEYSCHSHHMNVWLALECAFFLALLGWGIYVVYATWRNRAAVDSRWTLIAVYNTLIVLLVVAPLIITAVNSDDWIFYIAVLGLNFAVLSCVFSIYGSAILRRIWDSVSKTSTSGDSGEGPSKVSSLRMTVGATVQT